MRHIVVPLTIIALIMGSCLTAMAGVRGKHRPRIAHESKHVVSYAAYPSFCLGDILNLDADSNYVAFGYYPSGSSGSAGMKRELICGELIGPHVWWGMMDRTGWHLGQW